MSNTPHEPRGFTLIETIIAAALLATAIVVLAHLLAVGARQSAENRRRLSTIVDAQNKLEELRAIPWRIGVDSLSPSPLDSLTRSSQGYFDEAHGYVRRWAIATLSPARPDVLALSVCVYADGNGAIPDACARTLRARRP